MDPRTIAHDQVRGLEFVARTAQRYPAWNAALLADLTEALDLTPHLEKPLYMLSTGSKRKVWLAAALASGATLTLLDEPFAAPDKSSIRCELDLLREAVEKEFLALDAQERALHTEMARLETGLLRRFAKMREGPS
jgi:energy-coupling factor transporter ATP-binding protein EcfA2